MNYELRKITFKVLDHFDDYSVNASFILYTPPPA